MNSLTRPGSTGRIRRSAELIRRSAKLIRRSTEPIRLSADNGIVRIKRPSVASSWPAELRPRDVSGRRVKLFDVFHWFHVFVFISPLYSVSPASDWPRKWSVRMSLRHERVPVKVVIFVVVIVVVVIVVGIVVVLVVGNVEVEVVPMMGPLPIWVYDIFDPVLVEFLGGPYRAGPGVPGRCARSRLLFTQILPFFRRRRRFLPV